MKLTPLMINATWMLFWALLDDSSGSEDFEQLPASEQAIVLANPLIRSYLMSIVASALQSEADRLAGQ
jgi:hypothetical protein